MEWEFEGLILEIRQAVGEFLVYFGEVQVVQTNRLEVHSQEGPLAACILLFLELDVLPEYLPVLYIRLHSPQIVIFLELILVLELMLLRRPEIILYQPHNLQLLNHHKGN